MSWGIFAWLGKQWEWIGSQGWAAVATFALLSACLLLLALSTAYLAISKRTGNASEPSAPMDGETTTYEGTHYDLLQFILHYLLPAIDSQSQLQSRVIGERIADRDLAALAKDGIADGLEQSLDLLSPLGNSPVGYVSFEDMTYAVATLENAAYASFCGQGERLLHAAGYVASNAVSEARRAWRERHNALVADYERIKTDPRFPKPIYRGALQSRWGESVDSGKTACADDLVELFEEGVRERNRLVRAVPKFEYTSERERLVNWSNRIVAKMESGVVTAAERSRFKTLDHFEPEPIGTELIPEGQMLIQAMWSEKLKRLRVIIDRIGS